MASIAENITSLTKKDKTQTSNFPLFCLHTKLLFLKWKLRLVFQPARMNPHRFLQYCTRKLIAFGAESQLFVGSTALEYLAVWSILTTTASTFSSHVITTRPTVKQAWSCQRINAHGFTPFDVLDEMKPYMSSGHAKRLLNIK